MKFSFALAFLLLFFGSSYYLSAEKSNSDKELSAEITITPISHASMIIEYDQYVIYIDPTGGKKAYEGKKDPTYILITDIHGDHLDQKTLKNLSLQNTVIIAPKAVSDKLTDVTSKEIIVLENGTQTTVKDIGIEAIPMYNLRKEALKFHPKGRGNGYVITLGTKRIYISGDTEDIPEMRNLKNIDMAFICMNLPYTMPVESAASAVIDFKPKKVYPYHYRGLTGKSDIDNFKKIVTEANQAIEVVLLEWYP